MLCHAVGLARCGWWHIWQSRMNKQELIRCSVDCMSLRVHCKINSVCIFMLDFESWLVHSVLAIRQGPWDTFVWYLLAFTATPLYSELALHLVLSGSIITNKIPRPLAGCPCLRVWTVNKTTAYLFFNGGRSWVKSFFYLNFYKRSKKKEGDKSANGLLMETRGSSWLDPWSCGPLGRKDRRYALHVVGFRDQIIRVNSHTRGSPVCTYLYSSLLSRSYCTDLQLCTTIYRASQRVQCNHVRYWSDTYISHLKL